MRCVYPACNVADDLQDITFYSFPEEGFLRTAWLEALGKIGWNLEEDSVVCSKHFLTEDFLLTRNGRKLRLNAVPINVQMCRICFARNCKLYPMKDDKQLALSRPSYAFAYETLTGLSIDQEDKLPPYLCVKCAHQLLKCVRFRSKSIRAHSILMDILNDYGHVSIETIEAASSSYNAHSSDLNNKTYSDSTTCTTDEQDLDQEHVTYTIKAESVDIVDNDIVPNVKSVRDKGITTHLQDCYITNVVKVEIDNVGNGNIENYDKDHSPAPCEVIANNRASDDTICRNGLNKRDKNRDSNDNSKSDSSRCSKKARKDISTSKNDINLNNDKVHRESDRVKNINNGNMDIETKSAVEKCNDKVTKQFNLSFKGKDSSLNKSRNLSMKTTQKENLAQITAKDAKANLRIYDTKLEAVGNGGILLSFKLLSCDICKYQTVSNVKLMQHLKDHSASKVYNCSRCYFLTNSKKSLQFHTKTHCDINKHTCKICKKTFTFKNDLKTHERVHTGEKPFSCNVCKKKFSQQNQLRAHLRIHTGERPYSCNVCKKSFRQAGQLQNHMRIHSGEKPYSCDLCNKSFIQRGQLQNHFKRHNNEKPYSCDTCGKHFGLKGTLQNHMRMHTK